jgi:dipeptidyl aminopeptidase/acylaminoacyl peptidase
MRPLRLPLAVVMLAVVPLSAAHAQAGKKGRAFTPADWYRLSTISSPALSPDGKQVAFTVTTVNEAANKRHSEVWLVPAAGGEPRRLTSPGTESTNPRWSDDGKTLYFTSSRPGGKGSTWALRLDQVGEAFQPERLPPLGSQPKDKSFTITAGPVGGSGGAMDGRSGGWQGAPGGREEAQPARSDSARARDPYAGMAPTARPPHGAITQPLEPKRFDGRHVVELGYKSNNAGYIPNPREARQSNPAQLWRQAAGDTARKQLTETAYSHRNPVVSPDGRWIAFVADAALRPDSVTTALRDSTAKLPYNAARDEAERNDADIFIVPSSGGEPRRVLELVGIERNLAWSPDGKQLAFISSPTRTAPPRLYVVAAEGGTPRAVVAADSFDLGGYEWLPNGEILLSATVGGSSALYRVSPKNGRLQEVLGGRRRLSGYSYDEKYRRVAYVATSTDRPTELYIADSDGKNERRLTGLNDKLNAEIAWSDAERFTYESVGGYEIEGWLMKPYGYEPGKKYPLVFYIHGGPHSAYGENWFDEFQNITGAGMWVLYTNPRGSSGYGADFTYSTRGEWGGDDYLDLMKAVDIAAARPDVDSTRMGVTGGSYGGFMTAWITTKTDRFRAAQADRMISNWWSWYGSSDAQGLTEFEFFGKPWDNVAMYDTLSPIRYADRVETPTLIVQSEEDHRTPMTDAEQWFTALVKRGIPVEFVRYPRSNHDLSRTGEPWLLVDRLGRLRQWFSHWLIGAEKPASAVASE